MPKLTATKQSLVDLKKEAKLRGIKGFSKMKKAELLSVLNQSTSIKTTPVLVARKRQAQAEELLNEIESELAAHRDKARSRNEPIGGGLEDYPTEPTPKEKYFDPIAMLNARTIPLPESSVASVASTASTASTEPRLPHTPSRPPSLPPPPHPPSIPHPPTRPRPPAPPPPPTRPIPPPIPPLPPQPPPSKKLKKERKKNIVKPVLASYKPKIVKQFDPVANIAHQAKVSFGNVLDSGTASGVDPNEIIQFRPAELFADASNVKVQPLGVVTEKTQELEQSNPLDSGISFSSKSIVPKRVTSGVKIGLGAQDSSYPVGNVGMIGRPTSDFSYDRENIYRIVRRGGFY